MPPMPLVFVLDDDASVLRALFRLLTASGYAVEAFSSAHQFLERGLWQGEGCVITDLRMPGINGIELQQAVSAMGCDLPFVFITGHGQVSDAVLAMKGGAIDFLEKPVDPGSLLAAVEKAIARHRAGRKRRKDKEEALRLLARLSPRERQVCELVAQGLLNKQIAARLGTSEKTIKAQRGQAMRKLQATSPASLVDVFRKGTAD